MGMQQQPPMGMQQPRPRHAAAKAYLGSTPCGSPPWARSQGLGSPMGMQQPKA